MENDTVYLYKMFVTIIGFLAAFGIFMFLVRSLAVWILRKFWHQHIYFAANLFSWVLLGVILGAVRDITNIRYIWMGMALCAFPEMIILIYDCLRQRGVKAEHQP